MTAARPWASQVSCNLIEAHVAVIDFDEELHGTLQPDMQTSETRRLQKHAVIQILERSVPLPIHQKSSAEGIRL